jgi:hypothetical protein
MWFDEKSSTAPTQNESFERSGVTLDNSNANIKSHTSLSWRAKDLLDLNFTAIGTTVTPVYFKVYTDIAPWGAPAVVTSLWIIEPEIIFEFKGLKST